MTGSRNKPDAVTLAQVWDIVSEIRDSLKESIRLQQSDRKSVVKKFKQVDSRITDLEREINKRSVVISGIKNSSEDLASLVIKIFEVLDHQLTISDIDDLFRVGRQKEFIKVTFLRYSDKSSLLKKVKNSKLTTLKLGLNYEEKVYVNEALGPETSKIWKRARDLKKSKAIFNCFVATGKVFVVEQEGDQPIHCRLFEDLVADLGAESMQTNHPDSSNSEDENEATKKRPRKK